MSTRSEALARRIEEGAAQLAAFAQSLSDAQWNTVVQPDGRTVGVIVHHVAHMYQIEVQLASQIAAGRAIEGVTWGQVALINATHAREHAHVTRIEAVTHLRKESLAAANAVRTFTNEQLDRAAAVSLNGGAPLTAQFFIEDHALRHSWHHLARIRHVLADATPTPAPPSSETSRRTTAGEPLHTR